MAGLSGCCSIPPWAIYDFSIREPHCGRAFSGRHDMAVWEILAVWFAGSVVFTPAIGYLLHMSGKMAAASEATIISFPLRTAGMTDLSRRQPGLGASASHR
jgi:hypothetical protein